MRAGPDKAFKVPNLMGNMTPYHHEGSELSRLHSNARANLGTFDNLTPKTTENPFSP